MTAVAAPSHVPAYLAHLYPLPKPSQRKGEKPNAERRAVMRRALNLIAVEHGLAQHNNGGVRWTEPAARDAFALADVMLGVWPNKARVPALGVCLVCGQPTSARLRDVLFGQGACTSWLCGGNSLPPEEVIVGKLAARGYELVDGIPKRSKEKMRVRHTGFDPVVGREPCGQKFEVVWYDYNGSRTGCAVCHGQQIAVGYNDIASTEPALAAHLVDPAVGVTLTRGSKTVVAWRCVECGEAVSASPNRLVSNDVLPRCKSHTTSGHRTYLSSMSYVFSRDTQSGETVLMFGIANMGKRVKSHSSRGWQEIVVDSSVEGFVGAEMESAAKAALLALGARPTRRSDAEDRYGITRNESCGSTESMILGAVSVKVGNSRRRRLDIRKDEDWAMLCDLGDAIKYGNDDAVLDARRSLYVEHLANEAKHFAERSPE